MKNHDLRKALRRLKKNNISIIGHMGSGKSVVGKMLSKKFDFRHFDTDNEITNFTNKSINQIFNEKNGENKFRLVEKEISLKLINKKNIVISLGGGSILDKTVRKELAKKSVTLFLDVDLNELEKRLVNSNKRPLLKNVNIKDKIKELDSIRRKYYLLADIKIQNAKDLKETYEKFIDFFSNFND